MVSMTYDIYGQECHTFPPPPLPPLQVQLEHVSFIVGLPNSNIVVSHDEDQVIALHIFSASTMWTKMALYLPKLLGYN